MHHRERSTLKSPLSDVERRYLDKAYDSRIALWNALMTVNGLLIAAATIAVTQNPPSFLRWVAVGALASLISLILLTSNFLSLKAGYSRITERLASPDKLLTPEEVDSRLANANARFKRLASCERWAILLLGFNLIVVLFIIAITAFGGHRAA